MQFKKRNSHHGFMPVDQFERLVVVAVVALIAAIVLPALSIAKKRSQETMCYSKLRAMTLGIISFTTDNDGYFPFGTTNSVAYQETNAVWRHFMALSNELGSPKLLVCPLDKSRVQNVTTTFDPTGQPSSFSLAEKQNQAISYFLALRSKRVIETNTQAILIGDRNVFAAGREPTGPLFSVKIAEQLGWTDSIHQRAGNVSFVDGSSQTVRSKEKLTVTESQPVELLLPN
jgi:prepilin-type processing-associated H-X9-DG protein